jgi:hypothetical protein
LSNLVLRKKEIKETWLETYKSLEKKLWTGKK